MNKELKQKIEEAAQLYADTHTIPNRTIAHNGFYYGAQFLLDEGVRFTKEDMIDFVEYCHINAYKPEEVFGLWLKERQSK